MMKCRIGMFTVLIIMSCTFLLQYFYDNRDIKVEVRSEHFRTILYWTGMFDAPDFYLGQGDEIFQGCEFSNCYATSNKRYLPEDYFDAVLFHGNQFYWDSMKMPGSRSPHQYYVYVNMESPINTKPWYGPPHFFNWTMTYRSDSDVRRPYGFYKKNITNYKMPTIEEIRQKPRKIAWMVSDCNADSKRDELYLKLKKYIPIDVYGKCGNFSCPKEDFDGCYDRLGKKYKFYLSFENSICTDYVTEKLFAALMRDFIPIVYGGADYTEVAPPHSVIDATQFHTVKELAEFIKMLDEDPKKYLTYFEWKKSYTVQRSAKPILCEICKKLNEPVEHKSYSNIKEWWVPGMCQSGKKLPRIIFSN